jgi:hypothetical protein
MVDVQISEEETTKKKSFNPLYRNYEWCTEIKLHLTSFLYTVKGNAVDGK